MGSQQALGVAIVGAGDMGGTHAKFWPQLDDVRISVIADVDPARAAALAGRCGGVDHTTDIAAAIARKDVDIVSVCVPASFHAGVVLQALQLDKHVLSEKPIARTLEDADRIVEAASAAARRGIKYTISFQRRYLNVRKKQAELIQSGVIGRPVMMQSAHLAQIRAKLAMHELQVNGGPVVDFGVHQYDYWRTQFASEPIRVLAQGLVLGKDRPELVTVKEKAPDTVSMVVTFASGDIGQMTISWGLPPGIKARASAGEFILGPTGVLTRQGGNLVIARENGTEEVIPTEPSDDRHALFSEFVAAIREDKQPWITAEDGRAALRIAVAALESVATGRAVELAS